MPTDDETRVEFLEREAVRMLEAIASVRQLVEQAGHGDEPIMAQIRELEAETAKLDYLHQDLSRSLHAINSLCDIVAQSFDANESVVAKIQELRTATRRVASRD